MPLKPILGHWPGLAMAAGGCALVALLLGSIAGQAMMSLVSAGGMAFQVETISGRKPPAGHGSWFRSVMSSLVTTTNIPSGVTTDLIRTQQTPQRDIRAISFNQIHEIAPLSSFGWNCESRFVVCWMTGLEQADGQQKQNYTANGMNASDAAINLPMASDYDLFRKNDRSPFAILSTNSLVSNVMLTSEPDSLIAAIGSGFTVPGQRPGSVGPMRTNPPIKLSDQEAMNAVPAPVPWLGLGIALGCCRRMRRRLSQSQASIPIRVCSASTSLPRLPPGQLK